MRCRVVICSACCTRLNGVNHCHACLKALGERPEDRQGVPGLWAVAALACCGAGWLFFFGLFWLLQGTMAP